MKTQKISYLLPAIALSLLMFSCEKQTEPITEQSNTNTSSLSVRSSARTSVGDIVPNQLLVKFKPGTSSIKMAQVLQKIQGKVNEKILTKLMERFGDSDGVYVIDVPLAAFDAISKVKGNPEILYAEPNYVYYHNAVSNDVYYTNNSLWGMYGTSTNPANQFGSQAAAAWANGKTGNNTVYVGIIDEGYMYAHEDLLNNAGINPGEIAGNRKDDDGNGYVDDIYGWDFDGNNSSVFDGVNDDHGTHVAGTIGAVGGNNKGVAGVCWNVKLLNAKFLGTRGGTTANAIKAVDYFTDLKLRHKINLVATNNSWGGGGYSQALQDAITRANNAGILFIAAAGNNSSNNDAVANYPSNYQVPNVIAVASITSLGALSSFSNYGLSNVDLGAPGSGIISTVPVTLQGKKIASGYANYSGTSMATPHVTGAAALYASYNPTATAADIKNAILNATIPTPSLNGKCLTGGRLNVSGF